MNELRRFFTFSNPNGNTGLKIKIMNFLRIQLNLKAQFGLSNKFLWASMLVTDVGDKMFW